jgi:hypothetical protein
MPKIYRKNYRGSLNCGGTVCVEKLSGLKRHKTILGFDGRNALKTTA